MNLAFVFLKFLQSLWVRHKQDEIKYTGDNYNADYNAISKGIENSRLVEHLDYYAYMVKRFERKYKGTIYEANAISDTKILLNICQGKENLLTETFPMALN